MKIPVIQGVIDRRILVNFRADPDRVARMLPPPFRPKVVRGHAIAGICLIRLSNVRPRFLPLPLGISSENAAHRIAVEWDEADGTAEGVYIPRRDTSSRWNTLAGGRLFPGLHHKASFSVAETPDRLSISFQSADGTTRARVVGRGCDRLAETSIFSSLEEASRFFEAGSMGYSATASRSRFDGMELRCRTWNVHPLEVEQVESSFFDEPSRFPPGSAQFDCALLMRQIEHEWHSHPELCCPVSAEGS